MLDSRLKKYPISTFTLWQTAERINEIKNIGNLDISDTLDGIKAKYVLDGQQWITLLFAAYRWALRLKTSEKKVTNYQDIVVNLEQDIEGDEK